MVAITYVIHDFIPYAVVLGQVLLIAGIFLHKHLKGWMSTHATLLVLLVSIAATLGSLFYSEILGYEPCKLCWLQRICMYPLVIISAWSLKTKEAVKNTILTLATSGLFLSTYHYLTQLFQVSSACATDAVSCSSTYLFTFGYITIPLMAFTAFGLIILVTLQKKSE